MTSSDPLYEIAAGQAGYFTTAQAATAGYSRQLLRHHVLGGKFRRERRGIYRFVEYPITEHEHLVVIWLWSEHKGVFSHRTALSVRDLSDDLPASLWLTLPLSWQHRRLAIPDGVMLHFARIANADRDWFGEVPITSVARSLNDCARIGLEPDLLRQAANEALRRGRVQLAELPAVLEAMAPFGGLGS
jgi:predicted transcriptional regulator of viral defense system